MKNYETEACTRWGNTAIRFANEQDVALILDFIKDPAEYEKMSDKVVSDDALLQEWIFENKKADVIWACCQVKRNTF